MSMTVEEIAALPAREVDYLVAEKVMGWQRLGTVLVGEQSVSDAFLVDDGTKRMAIPGAKIPAFTTDRAQVYIVVEHQQLYKRYFIEASQRGDRFS